MVRFDSRTISAAVAVAALALTGCEASYAEPPAEEKPAKVEQVQGSTLKRITLIQRAADRLGVRTAPVSEATVDGRAVRTVPYSALLYDPAGRTWVYTSPQRLVFVRHEITVLRIEKDRVLISDGPAVGTEVATVAVAELYGTEVGVGK